MLTYIQSAIRSFRSAFAARRQPDLTLLGQTHRDSFQEQQARAIETRLFFDTQLLASAQARQSLAYGFKKSLLACGAGLLLVVSPTPGQAVESTEVESTAVESNIPTEETSLGEKIERWLGEVIGLLGDGDDPKDGEG